MASDSWNRGPICEYALRLLHGELNGAPMEDHNGAIPAGLEWEIGDIGPRVSCQCSEARARDKVEVECSG
jgi:hypothetical protein